MNTPPITFVTVAEAGNLEVDAVRLFDSLRTFGGALKDSPALAIRPRSGVPVSSETRRELKRLNVTLVEDPQAHRYSWFKFLPKPLAVAMAEKLATTPTLCWLDADILLTREPSGLLLDDSIDFLACCSDKEQGSAGPDDPFDPLWAEMAQRAGIPFDQLPWFTAIRENVPIRCYWNSGVFTFRRGRGFGDEFLRLTGHLLDGHFRLNHPGFGLGICEMVSVGFAMHRLNFRLRQLDEAWNYSVFPRAEDKWYSPERLGQAAVLHYHDSLWPHHRDRLLKALHTAQPEFARWLDGKQPTANLRKFFPKFFIKALRTRRDKQMKHFLDTARVIQPG